MMLGALAPLVTSAVLCQPGSGWPVAPKPWVAAESELLVDHVQLTSAQDFTKAGEAYFGPDGEWIIFQAVARPPEGEAPSPHYSMYVAKLTRDTSGDVNGIEEPILISPEGSANTCGWLHPEAPWVVMFGCTFEEPREENQPGYQRGTGRYKWQFPAETEVVTRTIREIYEDRKDARQAPAEFDLAARHDVNAPIAMFTHDGYDAEGSFSPCGRYVLYARMIQPVSKNLDLFIFDTKTGRHIPIVEDEGYDGGPFFSPDGKWICYRSDRRGDNLLQLYVAELAFDSEGVPTGITREIQLTDNEHVNWCPFWLPSSKDGKGVLVYATSEIGHLNYEVFAIEVDASKDSDSLRKRRVTNAGGFDGLPVFNADGSLMMWTSQRGPALPEDGRSTSQIWIAKPVEKAWRDNDALFGAPEKR